MNGKFDDPHGEPSKTWFRNLFNSLNEGGTWGIPRSGLMYRKLDGKFVCTQRMPHMAEMEITPEQLKEQQDHEIKRVGEHLAAAGITWEDRS